MSNSKKNKITIILFEPEIPQNTGNIIRTCSVTGSSLILKTPLGFSMSSRMLKRSSLDYFEEVDIKKIDDLETFLENKKNPFYFFSSKAKKPYFDMEIGEETFLIFGSETKGLPPVFMKRWPEKFVNIPMKKNARCLNLSNSVAIAIYEIIGREYKKRGF